MLEFALVAPIFFFLVFGIIEFGVLMFDVGSTRFAASEAAKVESQAGDGQTPCSNVTGCSAIPAFAGTACYADCQAIVAIRRTAVGTTNLEQVNYIEVQKMAADVNGNLLPVAGVVNRYNLDGTTIAGFTSYTQSSRSTIVDQSDYLQVNIHFTYRWLTGMFNKLLAQPVLDSKYLVRLEPQRFS